MRTIEELREHLFGALDGLRGGTMDIEKAKAVADVGRVIVDSAKVECEHMRITASEGSGFIPPAPREDSALPPPPAQPSATPQPRLVKGRDASGSR